MISHVRTTVPTDRMVWYFENFSPQATEEHRGGAFRIHLNLSDSVEKPFCRQAEASAEAMNDWNTSFESNRPRGVKRIISPSI